MIRNLKALALALCAMAALGAAASSAASANEFHSSSTNTRLTGTSENNHIYNYDATHQVICTHATFVGTSGAKTTTDVTVHATYTGCEAFGFPADVTTTGCDYTLTIEAAANKGPTHIVCSGTSKITITVTIPAIFGGHCTITVGAQTPTGHVGYANLAGGEITAESTVTGVSGSRTGNALCGPASSTTGTYTGNAKVTGDDLDAGGMSVLTVN